MDTLNQNSRWIRRNLIGKGSYGTVSLGFRESDGSLFAVKSADKDSLSSLQALENEIGVLSSLPSSPFIVEYYGDDESSSHRNLLMEYVPGGDVASFGGIADVELIRSYAWCLVNALRSVHIHGIVHCDVKGSNVLLAAGAGVGVAKLADFGSAKRIEEDDCDRQSRIVPCGSPLWMAPEVVRGESQEFKSDIWSLGCTIIEMFTGKPAWQDRGAHTLYQIGYSDDMPEYSARIPDQGKDFLHKCLDRDPRRRWSCDQLLQHPFLLPVPANKITEASPRSVLDNWQEIDFTDDASDHEPELEDFDQVSAVERIGKLATNSGVNWESDGWVEVRSLRKEEEDDDEFETGTSSENSNFDECPEVITEEEYNCDNPNSGNEDEEEIECGGDRCGNGGAEWGAARREKIDTAVHIDLFFLLLSLYSPTVMGFNYNYNYNNKMNYLQIRIDGIFFEFIYYSTLCFLPIF